MNCTDAERKGWVTLQARATLARFTASLIDGDDGRPLLIVSRWALTRSFTDQVEAERWLARVAPADPAADLDAELCAVPPVVGAGAEDAELREWWQRQPPAERERILRQMKDTPAAGVVAG